MGAVPTADLLGAGILGDSLGAFRHGMLRQLPGEQEANGGLDLPRGDGGPLVIESQTGSLTSDTLKDVIHEGVHDAHCLGGDASVGMDLLQNLVHVDGIGLSPGLSPLPGTLGVLRGGFLRPLPGQLRWWIRHLRF